MKVLLSIKPKYANLILDGIKVWELRKRFAKNKPEKIILYASAPMQAILGEFEAAEVVKEKTGELWNLVKEGAGITNSQYWDYFSTNTHGYALKVQNPIRYKEPKKLIDWGIKTAPQSFIYLKPKQINLF